MRFFLILFLFIFCTTITKGQNSTTTGYIIKDQDSIKGSFIYNSSELFPQSVLFNNISYTPSEIQGFGYEGNHFISARLADNFKFLKVIIDGKTGLYAFHDVTETYVLKFEGEYYILDNKLTTQLINGNSYEKESNKYKGKLLFFFQDCPDVIEKVNSLKYRKNDLIKVVLDYKKCKNEENSYISSKNKSFYSFFFCLSGLWNKYHAIWWFFNS